MNVQDRVRSAVEPVLAPLGVELVDVEVLGSGDGRVLRLSVDCEGGVDLGVITDVSQAVSPALDADDPFAGAYTLEVSSPGVERPLRTPAQFERAVGQKISVKTHADLDGARRHVGVLVAADDEGITLDVDGAERRMRFDQMAKARTVFEWGPGPKPGKGPSKTRKGETKKAQVGN